MSLLKNNHFPSAILYRFVLTFNATEYVTNKTKREMLQTDDLESLVARIQPSELKSDALILLYNGALFFVQRKFAAAWLVFESMSASGNPLAQFFLGASCSISLSPNDQSQAVGWYQKSAVADFPPAMFHLGLCYRNGQHSLKVDKAQAAMWFQKAAKLGHPPAQYYLAQCYASGSGVNKDEEKAVHWYSAAAELGYAPAQLNLGFCYFHGDLGVEVDKSIAVNWYLKSSLQGCSVAQYNLAMCYQKGDGIQKKKMEALNWLQKAAAAEFVPAKTALSTYKSA